MEARQMKSHESGEFFFIWTFTSLVGSVAGLVIGQAVADILWPHPLHALLSEIEIFFRLVIVGLAVGIFLGVMEWFVVRSYLPNTGRWWILTSVGIWAIFPAVTSAFSSLLWIN
jgi:hypothetical protein